MRPPAIAEWHVTSRATAPELFKFLRSAQNHYFTRGRNSVEFAIRTHRRAEIVASDPLLPMFATRRGVNASHNAAVAPEEKQISERKRRGNIRS